MKWWDDLRRYFYLRNINAKLDGQSPERTITNLHDANTIGILYDSTSAENDTVIAEFAEKLRDVYKKVEVLGFVNAKEVIPQADVTLFCKKDLRWHLAPNDTRVDEFAEKDFDLLLAAFTTENLPLEYVARTSQAKWRVGVFDTRKTDYYEMMIKTGENKDLQYFLDQSTHFLNKIQYDPK